jgi:hypothetical protein
VPRRFPLILSLSKDAQVGMQPIVT